MKIPHTIPCIRLLDYGFHSKANKRFGKISIESNIIYMGNEKTSIDQCNIAIVKATGDNNDVLAVISTSGVDSSIFSKGSDDVHQTVGIQELYRMQIIASLRALKPFFYILD